MVGFERKEMGRAKKWEFIYFEAYELDGSYIYLKEGKSYHVFYNKSKEERYTDKNGKSLVRFKNDTLFSKYKEAKGSLQREEYIKPKSPVITEKKEVITRYFARYNLDPSKIIFETDEMNFSSAGGFYDTVSLSWRMKGTKEEVARANRNEILRGDRELSGLSSILLNPLEFYREEIQPEQVMKTKFERLLHNPHIYGHRSDAHSISGALGLSGTHQMPDGSWMPGSSHAEYLRAMKKDTIKTPMGSISTRNIRGGSGY
jgi:hypothetical protein|tara:strand:+ start:524 stop:1300 length:777 start_codon:yes stop_codon:yes gene_type:complete